MKGKVVSINISKKKGVMKTPIKEGNFIENYGLEGDGHGGNSYKQVSLIGKESVESREMLIKKYLKPENLFGKFAENITTEGITLYELSIGTKIRIGETLQEITQIGKKPEEVTPIKGLEVESLLPLEGIFTKVVKGGLVKVGDEIEVIL